MGGASPTWSRAKPELFFTMGDRQIFTGGEVRDQGLRVAARQTGSCWSTTNFRGRANPMFDLDICTDGPSGLPSHQCRLPADKGNHLVFVLNPWRGTAVGDTRRIDNPTLTWICPEIAHGQVSGSGGAGERGEVSGPASTYC